VTLSGANTYTGGTTVNTGSLTLEAGGSLGADSGNTTVTGGTLTLNTADTQAGVTLTGGTIAGAGVLTSTTYTQSAGQMDGNVSATGLQSLNGGTVSGALSGTGNVTVGGSVLLSGTITSENVTIGGSSAGTLTNSAGGLAAGADLDIQANGGLVLTAADTIGSLNSAVGGNVTLSGAGTDLTITDASPLSIIAGNISGAGGLNVNGGEVNLDGMNTYSGATTLSGNGNVLLNGTLDSASGDAHVDIASGSQFTVRSAAGGLENTATVDNAGFFQVNTHDETIGAINGAGGIRLNNGDLTLSTGASSISGVVSDYAGGTGGLIVGGGAVTLSGANTYTGGTTVNTGSLTLEAGGSLGADSGNTTVTGGTLTLNTADTQAGVTLTGGTIAGAGVLTSTTYDQSGGLLNGTVAASGDQTLTGGTVAGALSGAGNMTVGGSVLLSGTIASNNITINGSGALSTDGGGLSNGAAIANAGTLTLTGDETVGGVSGAGFVQLNGGDLTLVSGNSTISGIVSGGNGLIVDGGDVTLSGANSYTGDTTVSGGGLTVATGGTLGATTNDTTVDGGTLTINTATTQNDVMLDSGTINGSATLTTTTYEQSGGQMAGNVSASGLQELSGGTITGALSGMGDVSVTGATAFVTGAGTIASNDITITGSGALSTDGGALSTTAEIQNAGTLTLTGAETIMSANGGGTIDLNGGDLTLADGTSLLSGVISGGNGLTVDGGAVTISGTTNTFTGPTTVADGDLDLTGNVGGNASVTGADAVLNVTGGTVGGSTTNDGGTINIDGGTFSGLVANMNGTLMGTGAVIGTIENQDLMTVATGETLDVTGSVTNTAGGTLSTSGGEIITSTGLFNTNAGLLELTNATVGGSTTNSARILALGTNTIGDLNNSGGTIDMRNATTTDVLNTGAITGGGTVQLNVNLDAGDVVNGGTSDQIISSGLVSGAFNFEFTPLGNSATYLGAPITVMDVSPGSTYSIANFSGLPVGGLAVYSLEKNLTTGDAELISETSSGIAGIGANASLVQSLIGSVVNRPSSPFVSGLASEEGCSQGGYFRGTYGKANVTGTSFNGVRSQETELAASYGGVQAGWDFGCNDGRFFDGWDGTFGALIGYNTGSTEQNVVVPSGIGNGTVVTSVTKTDFDQTYVGAYAAFNKDRLTADVQVRMERSKFTLNETVIGNFTGLGLDDTKFDAKSFNVTGRVSYRMDVNADSGISFVPTAGFSYSRTGASALDFDGGERLEMAAFNSFVGFAGGTLAKTTINEAGDAGTTLFVGGNYYHDFAGDRDSLFKYDVNDESTWQNITTDSIGGFGEISFGVNYVKILDNGPGGAKQLNANIRVDGRFGENISNAASLTGQFRLSF
jgi:fibronectin-binding autotransporter adhesin